LDADPPAQGVKIARRFTIVSIRPLRFRRLEIGKRPKGALDVVDLVDQLLPYRSALAIPYTARLGIQQVDARGRIASFRTNPTSPSRRRNTAALISRLRRS